MAQRIIQFISLALISTNLYEIVVAQDVSSCQELWRKDIKRGDLRCSAGNNLGFANLLMMQGVYCFNNGTGLCKGFSGRFEFYFNTWNDEIIGPVEKSQYVDEYGYHERVPVSYNINGEIQYADKSINWAKQFKKTVENNPISLLSINEFNWCSYTDNDWWPYKSSIRDKKSAGKYLIYFYNRQSCIVNSETNEKQHFNTRFLHNSSLRIDLDINPTIFAMEDKLAGEVRLVKHRRQHWYELDYEVIPSPKENLRLFVRISPTEKLPSKINGTSGPIIPASAYQKYTDMCVTDYYQHRKDQKNGHLVLSFCGVDPVEIADYTYVEYKRGLKIVNEVAIHGIPRYPSSTERFYGVNVTQDWQWEVFASDGLTFSATTTIPINGSTDKVRVISLYAKFEKDPVDIYDENYPTPYLSDYVATYKQNGRSGDWKFERDSKAMRLTNLNYVDDIAYLYKCNSILVIFGPLYSELPADKFDLSTKAQIDSIDSLQVWEMTSAFFAMPDSDSIWFYHRTNYIAEHKYTCGQQGELVRATKNGGYRARVGPNLPNFYNDIVSGAKPRYNEDFSEEYLLKTLGVFKGPLGNPDAPDPSRYPIGDIGPAQPQTEGSSLLVYIILGVAIVLILAMCIACLVTLRRRHKRRTNYTATQRSGMSSSPKSISKRSGLSSVSHFGKSKRSGLGSNRHGSKERSRRSSMGLSPSKSKATVRSSSPTKSMGSQAFNRGIKTKRSSNLDKVKTFGSHPETTRSSNTVSSKKSI